MGRARQVGAPLRLEYLEPSIDAIVGPEELDPEAGDECWRLTPGSLATALATRLAAYSAP